MPALKSEIVLHVHPARVFVAQHHARAAGIDIRKEQIDFVLQTIEALNRENAWNIVDMKTKGKMVKRLLQPQRGNHTSYTFNTSSP